MIGNHTKTDDNTIPGSDFCFRYSMFACKQKVPYLSILNS